MPPTYFTLSCVIALSIGLQPRQEGGVTQPDAAQCLQGLRNADVRIRLQAVKDIARLEAVGAETVIQIVEICNSDSKLVGRDAFSALEVLGAKATRSIPFLAGVLLEQNGNTNRCYSAGRALAAMGPAAEPAMPTLLEALRSPRPITRVMAVRVLGSIGPKAAVAVPALFDMAIDDKGTASWLLQVDVEAMRSLPKVGAPAVPFLCEALTSENDRHREVAAYVLYRMTIESPDSAMRAKSSLKEVMRDKSAIVRVYSALAYWNLSREVEEVRPVLLSVISKFVEDRNRSHDVGRPREVVAAIDGLRHLGTDAAPAVELLIEVLAETDGFLDEITVKTLGRLGEVATPAIPRLRQLGMSTTYGRMRQLVKEALENISAHAENVKRGGELEMQGGKR